MRKLTALLIIFTLCLSAFAASDSSAGEIMQDEYLASNAAYASVGTRFQPENAVMLGMGSAGLAFTNAENGLFYNPASLGEGKFRLSLPSVSASVYHVKDILKEDFMSKAGGDTAELVSSVLNVVGTQYAPLAKVDVSASMVLPFGLGIGLYAGDTVSTYSGTAVNELDAALVAGFGKKFNIGSFSISGGVTAEYNALVFNKRLKIADVMESENITKTNLMLASGWNGTVPVFDAGLTVEFKGFSAAVVVSNIFESSFGMTVRETAVNELGLEPVKEDIFSETVDFTIPGRRTISAGIAGAFGGDSLSFRFAVDLNDITSMVESLKETTEADRIVVKHLNAGVELALDNAFALRYGLNSGYHTAGATISLPKLFRIDAAYYWKEMGTTAGARGLDGLTIRFNLGWE